LGRHNELHRSDYGDAEGLDKHPALAPKKHLAQVRKYQTVTWYPEIPYHYYKEGI
jgi:hypothetical protein